MARLGGPRGRRAAALAGLIAAASFTAPAAAGSFKVNPVHITLPDDRRAASLTIENSDTAPVSVRVLTYAWTQIGGADVYAPTDNVIASPPIFTIQPGRTQLVRLGLKNRALASAYRVILEEIPRQVPVEGQIQVTLRLDLPLYMVPKRGGKAELGWRAWREGSGEIMVEGRNSGSLHGQVLELSAVQGGQRHLLSKDMGVVLPSSVRIWKIGKLPGLQTGAPLVLSVRSPAGETQAPLVIEQR
jgi:fimbrial chaperone protein